MFALGGEITTSPGAEIAGRAVAYPAIGAAWLTLLEGPSLGLSASSPVVLAAKLALLTAWLALTLLLMAVSGRAVLATSEVAAAEPARSFLTGLTAVLALFILALALTAVFPGVAGVPLLVLVVLFALVAQALGPRCSLPRRQATGSVAPSSGGGSSRSTRRRWDCSCWAA